MSKRQERSKRYYASLKSKAGAYAKLLEQKRASYDRRKGARKEERRRKLQEETPEQTELRRAKERERKRKQREAGKKPQQKGPVAQHSTLVEISHPTDDPFPVAQIIMEHNPPTDDPIPVAQIIMEHNPELESNPPAIPDLTEEENIVVVAVEHLSGQQYTYKIAENIHLLLEALIAGEDSISIWTNDDDKSTIPAAAEILSSTGRNIEQVDSPVREPSLSESKIQVDRAETGKEGQFCPETLNLDVRNSSFTVLHIKEIVLKSIPHSPAGMFHLKDSEEGTPQITASETVQASSPAWSSSPLTQQSSMSKILCSLASLCAVTKVQSASSCAVSPYFELFESSFSKGLNIKPLGVSCQKQQGIKSAKKNRAQLRQKVLRLENSLKRMTALKDKYRKKWLREKVKYINLQEQLKEQERNYLQIKVQQLLKGRHVDNDIKEELIFCETLKAQLRKSLSRIKRRNSKVFVSKIIKGDLVRSH